MTDYRTPNFRKDDAIPINIRIKKDTMRKLDLLCEKSNRRRSNAINLLLEKAIENSKIINEVIKY